MNLGSTQRGPHFFAGATSELTSFRLERYSSRLITMKESLCLPDASLVQVGGDTSPDSMPHRFAEPVLVLPLPPCCCRQAYYYYYPLSAHPTFSDACSLPVGQTSLWRDRCWTVALLYINVGKDRLGRIRQVESIREDRRGEVREEEGGKSGRVTQPTFFPLLQSSLPCISLKAHDQCSALVLALSQDIGESCQSRQRPRGSKTRVSRGLSALLSPYCPSLPCLPPRLALFV